MAFLFGGGWPTCGKTLTIIGKCYLECLQDGLITLHQNLHETRERKLFADPAEFDYIEGKLMAYQEVLAIFR
jgi:hypothetical protein